MIRFPTHRIPSVRRLLRWFGLAAAIAVLVVGLWLLDHLRPRHKHFATHHGQPESVEITEDEQPMPGVLSTSVRARADTGLAVSFRVLRPAAATEPGPLMVLLGGHRTGRRAVELVGNPGAIAVAALDYPYDGPEKIRGTRQVVSSVSQIQQALLDTPPAVRVALDWLIQQPWVDPDRVELVGVSLGTPFAAVAGALDDRFRRVWIVHGGADNREWLENTIGQKVQSGWLRSAGVWLLHLVAHGASFDTEAWVAGIAPRSVVIVGADQDESLSRENTMRLYAAAEEPKELLWTEGPHVKPNRPEVVRQLLELVRSRMEYDAPPAGTSSAPAAVSFPDHAPQSEPRTAPGVQAPDRG